MMQRAINQEDIDVFAWEAEKNDGNSYRCPHCKSDVGLRKGDKNIAHFSHRPLSKCPFNTEPESKEHVNMKRNFLNYLRKERPDLMVEVEKILISERKADMVIYENNQTFVIEFQASKIGRKELRERTTDYNKKGYPVLWIFHIQRLKLEDFTKNTRYQRVPDELEYLYDGDSLFVMNDNGYIQKCFLNKKPRTKSIFKPSFFNTNREFKFNEVIMDRTGKESLYLCQMGKDSRKSKQFYYYGYLFDSNKYIASNSKNIMRKVIQEELIKVTAVSDIYVYSPYNTQIDVIAFSCYIRSEDIKIRNSYQLGKGIYILVQDPLTKDKISELSEKVKLLNTPKKNTVLVEKKEVSSFQQVAATTTIKTEAKQKETIVKYNVSPSRNIYIENKKNDLEKLNKIVPWNKKIKNAVQGIINSIFKRKK